MSEAKQLYMVIDEHPDRFIVTADNEPLITHYFVNVAAKIPSLIEKGKRVFFFPQLTEIKGYNLKLVENTANKQKDT